MVSLRDALASVDHRDVRIAITGAGGWLGRELADLLCDAWGVAALNQALLLASSTRQIRLASGREVDLVALADADVEQFRPTHIVHLAFLTRDRIKELTTDEYVETNRALSREAAKYLELESVRGLLFTSSGAAMSPPPGAEDDLYGRLKRSDEALFPPLAGKWGKCCVTARVWSVSGANMQKVEKFALGSLISQAVAGGPLVVRATGPVFRRYVDVGEFLALGLLELLNERTTVIDSAGERIEVGDLARRVGAILCPGAPVVRELLDTRNVDDYTADPESMAAVAARYGVEFMDLDHQIVRTARGILSR